MKKQNNAIGIFDSGVGGLTVLKEIRKLLPNEDIVYFGDTARVPYGNKSKATVIKFSTENIMFLLRKNVKLIVVACNTASSLTLDYLDKIFSIPILGVIESGVNKALKVSSNRTIGVIGTKSTIKSQSYQKSFLEKDKNIKIYSKSCSLFVPFVEEGILSGELIEEVVKMYLESLKDKKIDTIVLGCTHYPLLAKVISQYLKGVFVVDSAKEVALEVKSLLEKNNLLCEDAKVIREDFYVSDEPEGFIKIAKLFLKREIPKPKVVYL